MRKLFIVSLLFPCFFSVLSVSALVCTDLQVNLKKGSESKSVLALQNFLFEKKFLTAKPNGYFGGGTEKAVQAYQASLGIPASGAVFAMTRGAIKKDSCSTTTKIVTTTTKSTPTPEKVVVATTTKQVTGPVKTVLTGPAPSVTAVDKGIIFIHGQTDWQVSVTGKNFATSSNTVYLQDRKTSKRYTVGVFASPDKTKIILPKSLGSLVMPCGGTCKKLLDPGEYFVVVETKEGGESYLGPYLVVRGLETTSATQTTNKAIPYQATSTKLGTCNFIAYAPTTVSSVTFSMNQGNATTTELSSVSFKDEDTRKVLINGGTGQQMYEGQYLQLGVYANVLTVATTTLTKQAYCVLSFTDTNSKLTTINSPIFPLSFEPEPSYVTELKNRKAPPEITSIDKVTILTNGTTTWGLGVYGNGFSSTTNKVYLASRINTKKYFVGVLPSTSNKMVVTLPFSLGTKTMTCGIGCEEKVPAGDYDLTVINEYGESNQKQVQVKSFTTSATTGTLYKSFVKTVKGARLGTVNIGVGAPLVVSSIIPAVKVITGASSISNLYLKDEATGTKLTSNGKDMTLAPNDSKTFGIYGDITTTTSASAEVTVAFDVVDYIGNKHTIITSPAFIISLSALTE
jgi:hypothetical protein